MLGVGVSPRLPCIFLNLSRIALHFPYISFTSPRHLSSISQYLPRLLDQRRLRPLRAQLQDARALVLLGLRAGLGLGLRVGLGLGLRFGFGLRLG